MKKLENLTNQQKIEIFENVLKSLVAYEKRPTGISHPYICWHLARSLSKLYRLDLRFIEFLPYFPELTAYKPADADGIDAPYWGYEDIDSRKKAVTEIIENLKNL